MGSSDKRENLPSLPAYFHQHLFRRHHHHHHHHLELSPHCPQHGGYFLLPNSHFFRHSITTPSHQHHRLELSSDCPIHGHLLSYCPLHSSNYHSNNQLTTGFPIFPNFSSISVPRNPNCNNSNSIPLEVDVKSKSEDTIMQDRNEEDEDEEEFIFVLTDEWKEFFAKSEAKRRLAKKQAKKKGKV